jgi:multiple sugar transport system substrate-binding protein
MGYALDLRPYLEADLDQATLDDWDPAQVDALRTRAGLQFGLPKYHGALALYYNKDIFDSCGVIYPNNTWDHAAYAQAMGRLSRDRDHDDRTDQWGSLFDIGWDRIQVHVNGWGGHFVDPDDPARSLMCEPPALAALAWLRDRMWDDHVMATPFDVRYVSTRQAFVNGQVAMVEDGSWALKDILTGAGFRIGVAPFPAGPARRVTLATSDGFGIFAGTRHPDAAWELVKFLVSLDYGRAMARANFLQPARASLIDEWVRFVREEFPERSAGVDIAAFAEGHVQGYSVTTEVFANMAQATQIAEAAWEQILALGSAPIAHMEEACRLIHAAQQVGGA